MSVKQKVCSYYLERKIVLQRWILVKPVANGLVVILFNVQNVASGLYCVWMSLSVEHVLVIIIQRKEKLEFKRLRFLEEVEKFCY